MKFRNSIPRIHNGTSHALTLAMAMFALVSGQAVHAATITWSGATNTWNTGSNWVGGVIPATNDSLIFGVAGAGGLLLNNDRASFTVTSFIIDSTAGAYVIGNGTATPNLGNTFVLGAPAATAAFVNSYTNGSASLQTINTPFSMTAVRNFIGCGDIALAGNISGSAGGIVKLGSNTLILSGSNSFTGTTQINQGVLRLNSANAVPGGIGASGGLSNININGGVIGLGAGDFTRALNNTASTVQFGGNGGWAAFVLDRVVNLGGLGAPASVNWTTANTGLNSKILILSHPTATNMVDFQNPLDMVAVARTVQVDNGTAPIDGKLSGNITGIASGNLSKTGLGTLLLTGTNNYVGTTTVSAGTLLVNGNNNGGAAATVSVSSGAALGGTGTVSGAVTVTTGGSINLRDSAVGNLNLGSSLTLSGSAAAPNNLYFDLGNGAGGTDKIVTTGAHSAATASGALVSFNQLAGTVVDNSTYTLIQGGAASTFTGYTLATTRSSRKLFSALGASVNNLQVTVAAGNAGPADSFSYWQGSTSVWNTAQWYSDSGGAMTASSPGFSSNVRFATSTPANLTNTLGQDFEINSLTVDSGLAATSISGNTLTIDATTDNSNTSGNGITVNNAAGTTIASKVGLAASQTWTVGTGAALTVSGAVSAFGGEYALTKGGAGTLTLSGVNTFSGPLTVSGGTLVIGGAGQLNMGSYGSNIVNNGTLSFTGSASNTLNGIMSGTGNLTKSGAGLLTLNYSSTITGGAIISGGNLAVRDNLVNPLGSGTTTVSTGGSYDLGATTVTSPLTLNGGTVTAGNSFTSFINGPVTLAATSTINVSGNLNINGNISGTGGLTKGLAAVVPLNGTNTYTGPTTINTGGLTIKSSLYSNDPALWTPANITVASAASLNLNVGGAGEFTIAQAGLMFSQLGGVVSNNGLKAGSQFGVDMRNASGTFSIPTNLIDSSGPGGGAVGFQFIGNAVAGGCTLELTGNNTYSGQTIIDRDGVIRVSSINSVDISNLDPLLPLVSSSLGRPTTVANGTISLGINASFRGAGLAYTGTGETTDRVLRLGGGIGNMVFSLDQSGSGLLKFTSNLAHQDNRGIKIFQLQGSSAGTAEFAGQITNPGAGQFTAVTKLGTGTWTLSAANLNAGGVFTVSGGCLVLNHATAIPGGIAATGGTSALTFSGGVIGLGVGDFTRPLAAAATVTGVTFTGAGGFAAYGGDWAVNLGGSVTPSTVVWGTLSTGLNGQTLILGNATATNTVDFQNPLDMGAVTRTVQADNGAAAVDGKISGVLSNGNLTKTGLGTLALTGINTYTGLTTVNAGTLLLDMTGSGALAPTSTLTLGGGTFSVKGKTIGSTAQTVGAFTLTALTNSVISLDPNGGTDTTLTLGNAWTRGAGASLLIDYSSANIGTRQVVTAAATTGVVLSNGVYAGIMVKDSGGVIGFATRAAGTDQPITRFDDTTGSPLAADSDATGTNFNTLNTVYSSGTLDWTNSGALTNRSVNSLTIDTTITGGTIDMGASTNVLTLGSGGIYFKGPNNEILTGGQVGAANSEVIVLQTGTGTLTINSLISSGTGSLTKNGTGTLILGGNSTYTGATVINEGLLKLGGTGSAPNSPLGTIATGTTVSGTGAALDLGGFTLATAEPLTLKGTGIASGGALLNSGGAATYSGLITLGATSSIVADNNIILSNTGTITGSGFGLTLDGSATGSSVDSIIGTVAGTVTKAGSGTWTLSRANTYTGATTVSAGTLAITGSLGATVVSVNAGTLAGNGNIGGSVTIASGAHHALTVATAPGSQVTRAITGSLVLTSGNILDLTAASLPADGVYVLATATIGITGTPTTVNYTTINGAVSTITIDNTSNPKRLLLTVGRNIILTGAPILAVNTTYGTSSTATSFTVAATNLAGAPDNLLVTPPSGYEVSLSSGSGYGSSVNVSFATADLAARQVFLRIPSTTAAGTYSGNISVSGGGATTTNIATVSSTVSAKALSLSSLPSIAARAYDTSTTAGAVTVGTLTGLVGAETLNVSGAATSYPSSNTGSYPGIPVNYSLTDGTGLASNYSLAPGSATGVINPQALSISPAPTIATRAYDTTTTAGAVTVGTLSGLIGGQTLSVTGTAANYSSANVGSYPGVLVSYMLINGTGLAGNYSLAPESATGVIIKATPTATLAVTAPLSVDFDGSPHAATVEITTSSVPGTVANILTGGAATQTTAAVYPVTADFVPSDAVNYNSLLTQSAGNYTINPGNTYANWLTLNGPATGFQTDSDGDGIPNGVENVLGSNPNTFNQGLTEVAATASSVTFKHTLNETVASDVTYGYRWSSDMTEWKAHNETNTGGTTATISASAPVLGVVTVTITITGGPTTKLFGQLTATK